MADPLHPAMVEHLDSLELQGRFNTASYRAAALRALYRYLCEKRIDPVQASRAQLEAYQVFLTTIEKTPQGEPLKRSTQGLRIRSIKAWYRWLEERGIIVANPARHLMLRVPRSRVVLKERLSFQEVTAFLQTQAGEVKRLASGSKPWAQAVRNLALLCIALATGRRQSGLISLHVEHVDLLRREIRCEREKGQMGRVLPVIGWANAVLALYLTSARPILVGSTVNPRLFVGRPVDQPITKHALQYIVGVMSTRTLALNPDLSELAQKRITWHCFRVSFASLLFQNGCDVRSINELMLHNSLSTTAAYLPMTVDDLRQVCRRVHPRR